MAFDGLATETDFVRISFIAFMNDTINSVVANLTLEFKAGNGNNDGDNLEPINASNFITDVLQKDNPSV